MKVLKEEATIALQLPGATFRVAEWDNMAVAYVKLSAGADSAITSEYDKTFTGFFGSCRALVGIQIPIYENLKLGSEADFSFLNYMVLKSGDLSDYSFRFPMMKWNFTIRYGIK